MSTIYGELMDDLDTERSINRELRDKIEELEGEILGLKQERGELIDALMQSHPRHPAAPNGCRWCDALGRGEEPVTKPGGAP